MTEFIQRKVKTTNFKKYTDNTNLH